MRRRPAGPRAWSASPAVPEQQLHQPRRLLGRAKTAMILTARGPEQQSHGVNNVLAFINLALALGKAGKPTCGYGCLTGQGNGQGGREHGQKADQLPGYRRIDNPQHRAHIAKVWGVDERGSPGARPSRLTKCSTRWGADGGVRALLVFGSNLAVSAPRAGHIEKRLDALDFLMVSDFFLSETAERADVVLPSAQWAEEEGTMTNLEGRVILSPAAPCAPPAGVRTDLEIMAALAERLGYGRFFPTRSCRGFRRIAARIGGRTQPTTAASPTSASGARTESSGLARTRSTRARRVCFSNALRRRTAARVFIPWNFKRPTEEPDHEYPLYLTTGRVMAQYQSGTQTRRVAALDAGVASGVRPDSSFHGADLRNRSEANSVRLTTRRGTALSSRS